MNHILRSSFLLFICSWAVSAFAQLPPNQPEQDCFSALSVCQDVYVQPNAYRGEGEDSDEINGAYSCMTIGERNSVWYVFTVQTPGNLCFTITPFDTLDDYDWAVFDLTNASCAQIPTNPNIEVACNWTYNNGCQGRTGPNGAIECPGQNEPCIPVNAGQTFVLNVSNFTASNSGYTLDFSPSSAQLFDDVPPELTGMSSFCYGVTVEFSENILCGTVDPGDFTFSGPDGPYSISSVSSRNCDNGGTFDNTFDLIVSPGIQQAGYYTLGLVGSVTDNCGNAALLTSDQVFMPLPPNAAMNTHDPQCEGGNSFGFAYTGLSQVSGFQWDFGDNSGSSQPSPIHSYDSYGTMTVSLVITDINGCNDTAMTNVEVLPKPSVDFTVPLTSCQGDTLFFENLTREEGGSAITSYNWFFADGFTTQEVSPIHDFQVGGRYQVLLEAFNSLNCRDTFSRFLTIYPAPDVDFITEVDVCYGDSVHLLFASTIQSDIAEDKITDWVWDFGDGDSAGQELAPVHLYDTAGAFPVTLWVVSDKGCAASLTKDQDVLRPEIPEINDDPVCFGVRAFLEAIPENGSITYWYHEMDDSVAFYKDAVFYTTPIVETQEFFVEAISDLGCISERVPITGTYHEVLVGDIIPSDSVIEFPKPIVNFSLSGNIIGGEYLWSFGDGSTSTSDEPAYEYQHPGLYEVTLNALDIHGCEYDFKKYIEVKYLRELHIPNAFSPNGDGFNDEFFIRSRLTQQFSFSIYNRFGKEIFQADQPDFRWDGYSNTGKPLREGVYVFRVRATDILGNAIEEQGTITLFR